VHLSFPEYRVGAGRQNIDGAGVHLVLGRGWGVVWRRDERRAVLVVADARDRAIWPAWLAAAVVWAISCEAHPNRKRDDRVSPALHRCG
jgi:hypothetical protein